MINFENGVHYIVINGIKHWCKIAGNRHVGNSIVILHGGPGGNHYVFERTIGLELEKFTSVIYFEQRGCGRSEPPENPDAYSKELLLSDLRGLIKELGLEKVSLLGYSFGGELAMEYALVYPETVDKLLLQAPSCMDDSERSAFIQAYGIMQVAEEEMKQEIASIMTFDIPIKNKIDKIWSIVDSKTVDRLLFHNEEFAKFNRSLWEESELVNTGLMFAALQKQKDRKPIMERVKEIDKKTLFLVGLFDRNTGVEVSRDLMSKIPNAQLEIFYRSAHFPDIEETDKYAKIVREFLVN